ncbi:MAG: polymerase sigma-70 factor, subfamily [Chthoniobacter sp.]|jgi:RNA polymerase sigma-70 factor (ECF subfamily)|nr:polymerase sigma-70 factor, subfamily [Chthoniobacter sp.]
MDANERELIEAAIHGDRENFEMIIPLFSRKLFAVGFAILQDREEAEDVVQETFFRAYKSRWRLRDPEKFPAWLVAVARNRARDLLRKRRTVGLREDARELEDTSAGKPDEETAGDDLHAHVLTALATLPEQHRVAVSLRYLEGMSHENIERAMGLSNGALRGILGRALEKMRTLLKPALAEERA